MTMYSGIDYSLGRSNFNALTGIHYGVISQHSLSDWIYEVISDGADFGPATCPKCGTEFGVLDDNDKVIVGESSSAADDISTADWFDGQDYYCTECEHCFWSDNAFSEEMLGWSHDEDGYKLQDCLQSDVFVIESPYYTYAQFCSPCVPGAGNLDNPLDFEPNSLTFNSDAPKTYCFGHDWFESGRAPYRVFKVADNTEVIAKNEVSK